jgi:hypothetical protein
MKVTLESTDKIVTLIIDGHDVPARVWEGTTAGGVACHAYVTRIAVANGLDASEFERALREHRPATPEVAAIPLRLII